MASGKAMRRSVARRPKRGRGGGGGGAQKTLLGQSDITYLGAFKLAYGDVDERPVGATLRWVNGQRRFGVLHRTATWPFLEFTVPTLVENASNWDTGAGLNYATLVKTWANGPMTSTVTDAITAFGLSVFGISWDETDKRIYYVVASDYDTGNDPIATVGWGVVDDDGNTLTPGNRVSFTSPTIPQKQIQGGVLNIPSEFATQYLSGKRLGAGFGTYRSVVDQGSHGSIGPAIYAIDPPAGTPADGDSRTGGPALMRSLTTERRQPRPSWAGNAGNYFEGAEADPSLWDWSTTIYRGLEWIDTGTKHGIIAKVSFIGGQMSATIASGDLNSVTVTNAADIVDVVAGLDAIELETGAGGNGNDRFPFVASIDGATITFEDPIDQLPLVGGACRCGGVYVNSTLGFSRWKTTGWLVYDPDDLALVAQGSMQPYDVVPAASWEQYPPMFTLPARYNTYPGAPPFPGYIVYDPVEKRIYELWISVYRDGTLGNPGIVFVYQVA